VFCDVWFAASAPLLRQQRRAPVVPKSSHLAPHTTKTTNTTQNPARSEVEVVLSTHAIGGLSMADFVLACKLDRLPVDYSPKWAASEAKAGRPPPGAAPVAK
jgi:hypothetical protein